MRVAIVPATDVHVVQLLPQVREADRTEFSAFSGMTAAQVLDIGLRCSTVAYAGLVNNNVVAIFGVSPRSLLTGSAVPWLVASHELPHYQKTFLRRCRPVVREFLGRYPFLENYVDARNTVAIRWLRWLGFQLDDATPAGVAGLPFHRFEMRRNQCAIR